MPEILQIYKRIKAIVDENPLFTFPALMTCIDEIRTELGMAPEELCAMMHSVEDITEGLERRK